MLWGDPHAQPTALGTLVHTMGRPPCPTNCSGRPGTCCGETPMPNHSSGHPGACRGETPMPNQLLWALCWATPVPNHSSGHLMSNHCHGETPHARLLQPCPCTHAQVCGPTRWDSSVHPRGGSSPSPAAGPHSTRSPAHAPCPRSCSQRSAGSDRCPAGARGLPAKPPLTKHILAQLPPAALRQLAGSGRLLRADGSSLR